MSNNLTLDQVSASQNQKEVTINAQSAQLDAALTDTVTYLITSTNARTLTNAELQRFNFITVDEDGGDPAVGAITLTVTAIKRGLFVIINDTAFNVTVTIAAQPVTAPVIPSGNTSLLSSDGTNVKTAGGGGDFVSLTDTPASITAHKMQVGNSAGNALQEKDIAYDVGSNFAGAPGASVVTMRFMAVRAFRLPSGLTNSQGLAGTAATALTDFDIRKNGSSIGTMRFAISGTVATFIFSTLQDFVAGDRLELVAPGSPDATLADIATTLAGFRRPGT